MNDFRVIVPQNAENVKRDHDPDKPPSEAEIPFNQALLGNAVSEYDADHLSDGLYELSKQLAERDSESQHHGLLGGEYGYGQDFKNKTFEMFPYWWGDCECGYEQTRAVWSDTHQHRKGCYRVALKTSGLSKYEGQIGAACQERNGHPFMSKEAHKAQKKIDELCRLEEKHQSSIYKSLCKKFKIPWNKGFGCAVHCTCDHDKLWEKWVSENDHKLDCPTVRPNFKHCRSRLEVRWYKYIGRGMTCNQKITLRQFNKLLEECLESL